MKKLVYGVLALAGIAAMWACDTTYDVHDYYGDFDLKPELSLGACFESKNTGGKYELKAVREFDSTYTFPYFIYDTLKDADGEPVLDAAGKLQITETPSTYQSKTTAHVVVFDTVFFPSFAEVEFDTLYLDIKSNCKWLAPMESTVGWYANVDGSVKGGGDGDFKISIKRFNNELSTHIASQKIFSVDSTKLFLFTFRHTGLKYTGK